MREWKKTKLRARSAELVKESWMRKMLQDAGSAMTIDAVSSEIVTLSSFDELKGSPGYYEALSQARLLPEAWQDKLNEEQGKAMERALSDLNNWAVYVNGDGSCALSRNHGDASLCPPRFWSGLPAALQETHLKI